LGEKLEISIMNFL